MENSGTNFNNFSHHEKPAQEMEKSPEILKLEEKIEDLKSAKQGILEVNEGKDLSENVINFLRKIDELIEKSNKKIEVLSK